MHRLFWVLLACALGCGSQEGEKAAPQDPAPAPSIPTEYGDAVELTAYLQKISPFIQEVSQLQMDVETQIGSTGKATGQNLSAAAEKASPRLQKALEEFKKIEPPPLLAPLHRDIEKLMIVRLDAYASIQRGWDEEQKLGQTATYDQAETKFEEANKLIAHLNEELGKVHKALKEAVETPQTASP